MTDRDAMIQAICTDPRCDSRRLAFADWLEDRGECDRAEFIRLSIRMAKYVDASGNTTNHDSDFGKMIGEFAPYSGGGSCSERGFIHEWSSQVIPGTWEPLAGMHQWDVWNTDVRMKMVWHRGFISSIRCDWEQWLERNSALFWHEKQTVVCGSCYGSGLFRNDEAWGCLDCGGNGHMPGKGCLPRQFPPTAQPLEEVRLTTWPNQLAELVPTTPRFTARGANNSTIQFDRATCICGGVGCRRLDGAGCNGEPLNEWHCDEWPGLVFRMPE